MGPFVNQIVGHGHYVPIARGSAPGELTPVDRGRQILRFLQDDRSIATWQSRHQYRSAGRQGERNVATPGVGLGDQQAACSPFGMAAQREVAGAAGRVTALVVEPQRHACSSCHADATQKRRPLRLVIYVPVKGDVAGETAKTLRCQRPQLGVLFRRVLLLCVNNTQHPGRRWWHGETVGQRSLFRRQLRQHGVGRFHRLAEYARATDNQRDPGRSAHVIVLPCVPCITW